MIAYHPLRILIKACHLAVVARVRTVEGGTAVLVVEETLKGDPTDEVRVTFYPGVI